MEYNNGIFINFLYYTIDNILFYIIKNYKNYKTIIILVNIFMYFYFLIQLAKCKYIYLVNTHYLFVHNCGNFK